MIMSSTEHILPIRNHFKPNIVKKFEDFQQVFFRLLFIIGNVCLKYKF